MGTMKKLLALVLALAMVMMVSAAFATSLTIQNATLGQEYKAYKIFDADIVDGAQDYRMMKREMVDAILAMSEYNRFSKGIFAEWRQHKV